MKEIIIDNKNYGQRIDKYLLRFFPQMAKSFLYKMFRKKNICLNQNKINGNEILAEHDRIQVYFADETFEMFHQSKRIHSEICFEILYEDEDVLAVNKPWGLLSQPNGRDDNLIDQLAGYLPDLRIGIVSRLDRNTTGVVLIGKNIQALQYLNQTSIQKKYHTIVCGKIDRELCLTDMLQKNQDRNKVQIYSLAKQKADLKLGNLAGRKIKTLVKPLQQRKDYTLLEVQIENGKTHQIRAHLASIGHGIIGDFKYGNRQINEKFQKIYGLNSQLLHCYQVKWEQGEVIADYPELFNKIANDLFGK